MSGVSSVLSQAWERALDLVFPPRCAGCGAFGAFLCGGCLAAMPRARPPRCPVCWMPVLTRAERPAASVCERCLVHPFAFKGARSPFVYDGAAREAVHALKYNGLSALAPAMAEQMSACVREWRIEIAALVPVPLAAARRRSRGYNQSELLARELSRRSGVPVAGLLRRRRASRPQALAADEAVRRANVRDAFAVRPGTGPAGALLLVDDVMTSGATLDACTRALREAGLGPLYALTFARED